VKIPPVHPQDRHIFKQKSVAQNKTLLHTKQNAAQIVAKDARSCTRHSHCPDTPRYFAHGSAKANGWFGVQG
jgi:hypothetical protein